MNIKILSDSTCDLSDEILNKYSIDLIPLTVVLGDKVGKDGIDITSQDIYEYVGSTGMLPVTAAINTYEYNDYFTKWIDQGYSVIHICLGSGFSSTYQNACIAAQGLNNVYVVDSRNLSSGQGLLVMKAVEMKAAGYEAEEIWRICTETVSKVEASFVIDKLDYLYKGGRCSSIAAFGANLLNIKPSIEVKDGKMDVSRKYRGKFEIAIRHYVKDKIHGRDDIDTHRIFVTHTECSTEIVSDVIRIVREELPEAEEIVESTAGATVTSHCGPNTLGILFLRV